MLHQKSVSLKDKIMEENLKDNTIKNTIDAMTGLAKAIPIYEDAIQPAAQELGKSLATMAKTINIALAPISAIVWGYEKISEFVLKKLSEKLQNVEETKIISPDPIIVGPALEALRFTGNHETLRELYANLIANSMDENTVKNAHPSFVEIIKNMSSDEALILQLFKSSDTRFPIIHVKKKDRTTSSYQILLYNHTNIGSKANCLYPELTSEYIDNLCRLGLLKIPETSSLSNTSIYEELTKSEDYEELKRQEENESYIITEDKKFIELTDFGCLFTLACVLDKGKLKDA